MFMPLRLVVRRVRYFAMLCVLVFFACGCAAGVAAQTLPNGVTRIPVTFAGGHDTIEVDHGRPVALIAAALNVPPTVFRDAFQHVQPAALISGGPTDDEARQNKAALLNVLAPYGVTDERLNAVSDFYRYGPGYGGLWKTTPAVANALVKDGTVIGYELVAGGAGYTTPPTLVVPGITGAAPIVEVAFSTDMEHNGAISAIRVR